MKTLIIREIGQALRAMSFRVDISGDADIYVSEVLNAKGNGNISMQLELTVGIAIDTKHKTLLYFESIIDPTRMLASSGVGRYITRVQQTTLGNIEEVTFDIGQIKSQVRAIAKQYGLGFKSVGSLRAIYRRSRQEQQEDQVLYEAPTYAQSRGNVEAALKRDAQQRGGVMRPSGTAVPAASAHTVIEPRTPRIPSGVFSVWVLAILLIMMVIIGTLMKAL